jgi:hypothetical protein
LGLKAKGPIMAMVNARFTLHSSCGSDYTPE